MKTIVFNSTKQHTHTMFILHGYSCTARSMRYYTSNMNKRINKGQPKGNIGIKYIAPQAPKRRVSCYSETVPCWYNYFTDYCDKEEIIDYSHVMNMTNVVKKMIDIEVNENLNGDYSKVFVAGNSQGACQALDIALSITKKIGGVISFRGHTLSNTPTINNQNVWASHGELDDAIGFSVAEDSYNKLSNEGFNVTFHKDKDLDHYTHSSKEFDSVSNWIRNLVES